MAVVRQRAPRERSLIRGMHVQEPVPGSWTVYPDCILTRRKRHHMVTYDGETVAFRSRWWSDIIDWLADRQVTSYKVVTDRGVHRVSVHSATDDRR